MTLPGQSDGERRYKVYDPNAREKARALIGTPGHDFAPDLPPARTVARIVQGPYTLLIVGDSYEDILERAGAWVEAQIGRRLTPTYYTDLSSVFPGVIGTVDEEHGDDR